ncbi:MAG TPA: helix-turn-helix domain-containing protein [Gemmatimonadales bacterium]
MRPNLAPTTSGPVPALARAVMDALDDGVVVFDSQGRLLYANEPARGALGPLGENDLRARLAALGARAAPLRAGPEQLGEAVFLHVDGPTTLAERERRAIVETLRATSWRLAEAARRLGISRTTLWRRLKAYGLSRDDGSTF